MCQFLVKRERKKMCAMKAQEHQVEMRVIQHFLSLPFGANRYRCLGSPHRQADSPQSESTHFDRPYRNYLLPQNIFRSSATGGQKQKNALLLNSVKIITKMACGERPYISEIIDNVRLSLFFMRDSQDTSYAYSSINFFLALVLYCQCMRMHFKSFLHPRIGKNIRARTDFASKVDL